MERTSHRTQHGAVVFASVLAVFVAGAVHALGRPFTVRDSIEMVRIVDAEAAAQYSAEASATAIQFSPDRRRFTVVTRNGNLETGQNEYRLALFDTEAVLRFVRSQPNTPLPRPDVLVRFDISQPRSHEDGISNVKWMADSETLAFIGRGEDRVGQVYSLNVGSRQLRKLTEHPENVVEFDVALERSALIFSADVTPNWNSRNTHGYAVKSEPINYLVTKDPSDAFKKLTYFAAELDKDRVIAVHSAAGFGEFPRLTVLSPNGRSAVVLMKAATVPSPWAQYDFLKSKLELASRAGGASRSPADGSLTNVIDEDWYGGGLEDPWRLQFGLVDLASGATRPLVGAPISVRPVIAQAAWSRDGLNVIVGATYLPLADVSGDELDRRARFPAVAEIEIATGKITRVADLVRRPAPNGQPIGLASLDRLADDWIVLRERVRGGGFEQPPRSFRKRGDSWSEERQPVVLPTHRLKVVISQDSDTPPELAAVDLQTGRKRVITDFNPRFRTLTLGRTERFEWTDRLGRSIVGDLLFPPAFKSGVRYPLVIQNYWVSAGQFLVDGAPPEGAAGPFAARPLANRGCLVLQMDADVRAPGIVAKDDGSNARDDWQLQAENPRALAALEGAIDDLDARGLIDPARVGLIGWSRSGMHVLHAVTFGCRPIAAASIADSHGTTPWIYVLTYGRGSMLDWESERLIGAPFWGEGIRLWQERSPAFHLNRIRTPLRYEHYGIHPPNYWDTFVMLKRHSRPVEMIHLPLAGHALESPYARYTAQEGNVDWFDFWLNGREDPDPAKAEQYARWRKLRQQHEAHLRDVRSRDETPSAACTSSGG